MRLKLHFAKPSEKIICTENSAKAIEEINALSKKEEDEIKKEIESLPEKERFDFEWWFDFFYYRFAIAEEIGKNLYKTTCYFAGSYDTDKEFEEDWQNLSKCKIYLHNDMTKLVVRAIELNNKKLANFFENVKVLKIEEFEEAF